MTTITLVLECYEKLRQFPSVFDKGLDLASETDPYTARARLQQALLDAFMAREAAHLTISTLRKTWRGKRTQVKSDLCIQ